MNTQSIINKLTRAGLNISNNGRNRFWADTSTDRISWLDQSGSAVCLRVRGLSDQDDILSDYTAGVYADSITQALKLAGVK